MLFICFSSYYSFHISSLSAANQLKQDVDCVIFGSEKTTEAANQLQKFNNLNIKRIFVAENAAFKGLLSESVTPVLLDLQKKNNYTHILGGSSTFTKGILPRLAALLDVQPISDITKIIDKDQYLRFIYAGNAILKLKSNDPIKIITIRGTAFEAAKEGGGSGEAKIEKLDSSVKNDSSEFVTRQVQQSERPELPSARIVCVHFKFLFLFSFIPYLDFLWWSCIKKQRKFQITLRFSRSISWSSHCRCITSSC
jgi:electron transfer flavoprotein alpha subunit